MARWRPASNHGKDLANSDDVSVAQREPGTSGAALGAPTSGSIAACTCWEGARRGSSNRKGSAGGATARAVPTDRCVCMNTLASSRIGPLGIKGGVASGAKSDFCVKTVKDPVQIHDLLVILRGRVWPSAIRSCIPTMQP